MGTAVAASELVEGWLVATLSKVAQADEDVHPGAERRGRERRACDQCGDVSLSARARMSASAAGSK